MKLYTWIPTRVLNVGNFATARSCCQQNVSTVELVDHTYDGRSAVYYTSVDRNALTPLLLFIVDLLYNVFLQLCSS